MNWRRTKKTLARSALALGGAVFLSLGWLAGEAQAATLNYTFNEKAILAGVLRCYQQGKIESEISTNDLYKRDGSTYTFLNAIESTNENFVALPSGLTGIDDNGVSCKQLFDGYPGPGGSFEGVFDLFSKQYYFSATGDSLNNLMAGMGYTWETDGSEKCIHATFERKLFRVGLKVNTNQICAQIGDDGKITNLSVNDSTSTNTGVSNSQIFYVKGDKIRIFNDGSYETSKGVGDTWDDFVASLQRTCSEAGEIEIEEDGGGLTYTYTYDAGSLDESESSGDVTYTWRYETPSEVALLAINYLTGGSYTGLSQLALSNEDQLGLLVFSLKNWFFEGVDTSDYWMCDADNWSDYAQFDILIKITADVKSPSSECHINSSKTANSRNIHGFTTSSNLLIFDASGETTYNLQTTIDMINDLADLVDLENLEFEEGGMDTDSDSDADSACTSAAGSLGWVLCPIIEGLVGFTQTIYDGVLEEFLEVTPELFEPNGYSYDAWKLFRDLANLILVFAMLIMILSQLTGFGVSNYGVKKYLPRIVAVAILVNISFFVCQLAVDVSNVVGASVNNFLNGIADQAEIVYVVDATAGNAAGGTEVSWFSQFFGWGAVLLLLGASVAWVVVSLAAPLAILFTFLSAALALVLMFVLLGLRQAVVLLLVVLSPLVVALYALPNTEKLAKQALQIFSKMLLMFPVAGALFGGSALASKIILGVTIMSEGDLGTFDGFLMYLTALIVAVVPLFALPFLVKKSFAAAGGAFRAIAAGGLLGAAAARMQGRAHAQRGASRQRIGAGLGANTGLTNWNNTRKARQSQQIESRNNERAKKRVGAIQSMLDNDAKAPEGERMSQAKRNRLQTEMGILGGQAAKYDQEKYDQALGSAQIALAGKSNDDIVGSLRQMQKAGNLDSADAKAYAAVLTGRGGKGVEDFNSFAQSVADSGNGGDAKAMADIYYSNDVAKNTSKSVVGTTLAAQFSKEALRGSPDDPHAIGRDSNGNSIAGAAVGEKLRNASAQQWANMSDDEFKSNVGRMSDHARSEFYTNAGVKGSLTDAKAGALRGRLQEDLPNMSDQELDRMYDSKSLDPATRTQVEAEYERRTAPDQGTGRGSSRFGDDLGHVSGDRPHSRT